MLLSFILIAKTINEDFLYQKVNALMNRSHHAGIMVEIVFNMQYISSDSLVCCEIAGKLYST